MQAGSIDQKEISDVLRSVAGQKQLKKDVKGAFVFNFSPWDVYK